MAEGGGTKLSRAEARRRATTTKMRAEAGSRWRTHYDVDGPRVRLGLLWFVGAMVALTLGPVTTVSWFGVAFAAAAAHTTRTWRANGRPVDPRLPLGATAAVVVAAGFGNQAMGVVLVLVTLGVIGLAVVAPPSPAPLLADVGLVLQGALPTAVAGGCLVLLADREVWAAVALVLVVSAYETGDFLIGSGAANSFEGPAAGTAAVLVMSMAVAAAGVPPFGVGEAMALGLATAPLAFLGQMLGTAMVPHARSFAPALRRVDSLLVAAPVWYVVVTRVVL